MLTIALTVAALTVDAHACAGFYHDDGASAESDVQRAVLRRTPDGVEVTYEVDLSVDTGSFGWVIPTPGAVVDVADGDPALIAGLLRDTAPQRELTQATEGGGCAGAAKGSDSLGVESGADNGVEVVYTGATPTYDYAVLEATSADALQEWLADNGWGDGGGAYDGYIDDGGWQFVAIKLSMDVSTPARATLSPITLAYEGDRMVYPSRMAQGGMQTVATTVFVVGNQRARVSAGWTSEDLLAVWDDGEDPDYIEFVAYPEAVALIGADRGFAVTFAGPWQGEWATRFETIASPSVHVEDAEFELDGGDETLHTVLSNQGGCQAPEGAAIMAMFPLLALWRRRR